MSVEGHQAKDGEDMQAFMNALSPGYFATMGIPILEGRDFNRARRRGERHGRDRQPPVRRALLPGQERGRQALGRGAGPNTKLDIEIIGVVADSLYEGPREGVRRQVFVPNWGTHGVAFYVRTTTGSAAAYSADPQRGEAARRGDAGLRDEDARGAARRDAADRSADRAARPPASACSRRCWRRSASTA